MNMMRKKARAWALVAAACLGIHDLVLVLAYIVMKGGFSFPGLWETVFARLTEPGDAVRYLDIAQNGYVTEGKNAINLVFYPLYPFLTRCMSFLTGSLPAAGLIVSQMSYAAASVLLYELLLIDGDSRRAWDGALLMALYPYSVFVMGVFSEGLFLMLSIGCLLALRRKRYVFAGIAGFLAALTRVQGMLLVFPAVCEVLSRRLGDEKRKLRRADAVLLLIPAGFGCYLLLNYALHGNCFQFMKYEAGEPWYQSTRWIADNISIQLGMAEDNPGLRWIIYLPQIILYFFALAVLMIGVLKKERISEMLYGGAYLGFTYLSGWMISGGRYMLCCVPLFIVLSRIKSTLGRGLLLSVFGLLCFAYTLFYLIGYAIM